MLKKKLKKSSKVANKKIKRKASNTEYKKNLFLKAFRDNFGHIGRACMDAGIARSTFKHWRDNDPRFCEQYNDLIEYSKDDVEQALKKEAVSSLNITALIFLAKTLLKDRGYTEKVENDQAQGNGTIIYEKPDSKETTNSNISQ